MGRSSHMLLKVLAVLLVLLTLIVGSLRLALPNINQHREFVLDRAHDVTGIPMQIGRMDGSWEMFGPTLDLRDISLQTPAGNVDISRVTLALDVWQSLLHFRWQFRDLTFYRLTGDLDYTFGQPQKDEANPQAGTLENIFLKQFDHFILKDSQISFLGFSGERVSLNIPSLTWLNDRNRHRAEGQLDVSTPEGKHGLFQLHLDLNDQQGLLDNGTVYLQADNVDMLPWLSRWFKINSGFDNAQFSLASWLHIKDGEINGGDVLLSQGNATWHNGNNQHRMDVDQLTMNMSRQPNGWRLDVPSLNLKTDGNEWPKGKVSLFWQPEAVLASGEKQEQQLRIRASNLNLDRINPLLPIFSFLTPDVLNVWFSLKPQGDLPLVALDIPLQTPEQTRFLIDWKDASWQPWQRLPGGDHTDGSISGSASGGMANVVLNNSTLPYDSMFKAPLEVSQANVTVNWLNTKDQFRLWSDSVDVQAKSLWVNGGFDFTSVEGEEPWLNILAGIRVYDGGDAWRYFPVPLMGQQLADYLSSAILAGKSDNATLIFSGNPKKFPYRNKDGLFEVYAPLRDATFKFQPTWQPLTEMPIVLDFVNDGLWMNAAQAKLGNVNATNIEAIIKQFDQHQLVVTAEVSGEGRDVRDYFNNSPMKPTIGSALNELDIGGKVSGHLQLDIPLNGHEAVKAQGKVRLNDNSLFIKPIGSTLENLSGSFSFDNGNLLSEPLTANWFEQPIGLNFSTQQTEKDYKVNVTLNGNWALAKLPWLPDSVKPEFSGNANWNSVLGITLPPKGTAKYNVIFNGDLKSVSSHLPAPLNKTAGTALPIKLDASGDLHGFTMSGLVAGNQAINSQWTFGENLVKLSRFAWAMNSVKTPALPATEMLSAQLPALDAEQLFPVLAPLLSTSGVASTTANGAASRFQLPERWRFSSPQVALAGQYWRNLTVDVHNQPTAMTMAIKGNEINGTLNMPPNGPLHIDLDYLYFNPKINPLLNTDSTDMAQVGKRKVPAFNIEQLPPMMVRCKECWGMGQRLGSVNADLSFRRDSISVTHGLIDAGVAKLIFKGDWLRSSAGSATQFDGTFSGDKLDRGMNYFGVNTPLQEAPFNVVFNFAWQGAPWKPQMNTLNGQMTAKLGKGRIANVGGHTSQVLQLLSFNSLLRKLQLDFSDTFSSAFLFDSINGTTTVVNGIAKTNDLLVDGLSADIAIDGKVDLVNRRLALNAVVAPEISTTVGVATAFVINPIAGAAVFAASQVLSPIWNKVSFIRYKIDGDFTNPVVDEVLRKPKED
ncbi:AsmA2 domain-containing protein YhdP [Budvicia diplopodorum]|uniref:AsmA2 domain-containing protein YhdP n=1 Tax=Budvicia diplopodorum TaxID=1119056 RepID=UPI00135A8BC3|nr:AsmA2 domain-containing protein YhdP [Budvicia diplopodorum]